ALVRSPGIKDDQSRGRADHGNGALAKLPARVQSAEDSGGAREWTNLAAVVSPVQADQVLSAASAVVSESRRYAIRKGRGQTVRARHVQGETLHRRQSQV